LLTMFSGKLALRRFAAVALDSTFILKAGLKNHSPIL